MSNNLEAQTMLAAHLRDDHGATALRDRLLSPDPLDALTRLHVLLHQSARDRGEEPEVVEHRVEQLRLGLFRRAAILRHGTKE